MKNFTTIQALIFGIAAGIALSIAVPVLAQNSAVSAAELQARQKAAAALGRGQNYVSESVSVDGDIKIVILEDHKRNRLCYIPRDRKGYVGGTAGMSCGPLNRNNVR